MSGDPVSIFSFAFPVLNLGSSLGIRKQSCTAALPSEIKCLAQAHVCVHARLCPVGVDDACVASSLSFTLGLMGIGYVPVYGRTRTSILCIVVTYHSACANDIGSFVLASATTPDRHMIAIHACGRSRRDYVCLSDACMYESS